MDNSNQLGKIVSSEVGGIEIGTELAESLYAVTTPREQRPQVKFFPGQTHSLLIPTRNWRA